MYKILSHTADFKVKFIGKNFYQLIESVMEFYFDNLEINDFSFSNIKEKTLTIEDEGIEFIIVRLINELIFLKDLFTFVKDYEIIKVNNNFLEIKFYVYKSNNTLFKEELKSATYHNLKIIKKNNKFEVEVVIDM